MKKITKLQKKQIDSICNMLIAESEKVDQIFDISKNYDEYMSMLSYGYLHCNLSENVFSYR